MSSTAPRYQRLRDLIDLALAMAGDRAGLSLADIEQRFGVSRRTAERMRDALDDAIPGRLEAIPDGRSLRWSLPYGRLGEILAPTTYELAELEGAGRRLRAEGAPPERADALERLAQRVRAALRDGTQRRLATDVGALMEAEGAAARPGPRPVIPPGLLATLRDAILACGQIDALYARPGEDEPVRRQLCPLGLLHGARPYLVASVIGTPGDPTLFRLDRMLSVTRRREAFTRDPAFDLASWAGEPFGVWRGEPEEIVLRFDADAASEARNFHFHRTQAMQTLPDGGLEVRFTAGGWRELMHHLVTWGTAVEVMAPEDLRQELARWSRSLARHHGRAPAVPLDKSDEEGEE